MSQKSSLHRTIEILKELNTGKKLCVSTLAQRYEVSDRTIRRDFSLIKEMFGDFMSKEGECYQAYKKIFLEDVLSATDLMTLANIVNVFGITQKESVVSDKTAALIKKSMSVYDFKTRPYESIKNRELIKKLEHAIKFNKEIEIKYKTERAITEANFHPYKILFLNENFYMVGENVSNNSFQFRRVSMIEDISYKNRTFIPHSDIQTFIETIQTPWSSFGKKEILVQIRVHKSTRRYFILKDYLPSQKLVKTYENGDILVEYKISNVREIDELLIKWLPNIEIIYPRNLKKRIKKTLQMKMNALSKPISLEK